jgi:hypothetical protein
MDTVFIPLKYSHATKILELHKQFVLQQEIPDSNTLEHEFSDLNIEINNVLKNRFNQSGQAFVKLSSRSPKDVTTGNFDELVQNELSQLTEEQLSDNHQRCCAFVRASCKLLRISSFEQVMQLLIQSERVFEDITQELSIKRPDEFNISLVLREWKDIDFDLEFRGFVHNNKLTALSQYNQICFIEDIHRNKDLIEKRILQLFDIIQPKLQSLNSYVLDFTADRKLLSFDDKVQECVTIVEVNPYEISTGSCLFDWKTERNLLENGPFEFRIVDVKKDFEMKLVNSAYHKYFV